VKYYLIAGEASGDLHGSALMKSLKDKDPDASFRFLGGDRMKQQGGVLVRHYQDMAYMGAIEVLLNLRKIRHNMELARKDILDYAPDVLILIDYPGFNIKMAEFAHHHNIRVFWFIAPKVWAWKEWRVKKLRSFVDHIFTILPFETEFFRKHGIEVHYVGNPLIDAIENARQNFRSREVFLKDNQIPDKPLVALLPGSRVQEIRNMLPVMTRVAIDFPGCQFVVSGADAIDPKLYSRYLSGSSIPVLYGQTYEMVHHSEAALVASGTATLETALLRVPQTVLYKMIGGKIFYWLFRKIFLKVPYVSLPNLVLGKCVIREFIMDEMRYEKVKPELQKLLNDRKYTELIVGDYDTIREKMGSPGAADRTAGIMFRLLKS
jgi:lipid-A-disaccharide synthase